MTISRRKFLSGVGGAAGLLTLGRHTSSSKRNETPPEADKILLKGGYIISMDDEIGELPEGDILIENGKISRIAEEIESQGEVIDASDHIIIPGFVDTHRHMWQGTLRNILPNGTLEDYMETITGTYRSKFRPEDAYIGDLVSGLSAISAGVTTVLDWSHIGNSPDHTDAAIEGLMESGIRGVYAYGGGAEGEQNRFPEDIKRLREEWFNSDDQLVTLAMAAGINEDQWKLARDVGASISVHVNTSGDLLPMAELMGEDVTCIHCARLLDEEWELMADFGAGLSISAPIEMQMGHGIPPIMQARRHGIKPSLSVDVETSIATDMFTQMRSIFSLQRMQAHYEEQQGDTKDLMTVEEALEYATLQGAKDNGLADKTGSLSPGKAADLIALRTKDINVFPVNHPLGAAVLNMDTSNVDMVMINGKIKKWKGELIGVDLEKIFEEAAESQRYLTE